MSKDNTQQLIRGIDAAIETIISPMMAALGPLAPFAREAGNYLGDAIDKGIDYLYDKFNTKNN